MTNEERARRWIEDRDLGRATVESDVMSLAMQFDKVREAALQSVADDCAAHITEDRGRIAELERAIHSVLTQWHTGHNMHFDRQGNSGATCPACQLDRSAREVLRAVLGAQVVVESTIRVRPIRSETTERK